MEEKEAAGPSNDIERNWIREFSELDEYLPGVICLEICSLPENLRRIVIDYISDDTKDPTRATLLGEQRVTICLSQHDKLELGAPWHFGCLSLEDRWKSTKEARINHKCLFKDYNGCLRFLNSEESAYCQIVIDVLVIQVDLSSEDFPSSLEVLEYTLTMLRKYLKSVQHVVFALTTYAFCCFSFKDVMDNATGLRQTVDRLLALIQIIRDLRTCWETNHGLNVLLLLEYYILNDDNPISDEYLSKFVVSFNHNYNGDLISVVDPTKKFSKFQSIYYLENHDDFCHYSLELMHYSHAIYVNASNPADAHHVTSSLKSFFNFQNNDSIERIVFNSHKFGFPLKLPRPSAFLTGATSRSALIELSLTGDGNTLDLSLLNNDNFPHLVHLSILGGQITGRLDSHCVPSLRTLIIGLESEDARFSPMMDFLMKKNRELFIETGRPWQLVASSEPGGWSLASYDETTPNPHDDAKEELPPSHPFIHDLLLMMRTQKHADEWQSRLSGEPLVKAAALNHDDGVLVWAPDRVQRITALTTKDSGVRLSFEKKIVGQIHILSSLECRDVNAVIHGESLPCLQSLKIYRATAALSGAFPQLKWLSLERSLLTEPWELNAPLLMYLNCFNIFYGSAFSFRPKSLPHLSYLEIALYGRASIHCPTILLDGDNLGLSRIKDVVFEKDFISFPFFDQCRMQNVLHLELSVDAGKLPACWENTEWLCQTLTIHVSGSLIGYSKSPAPLVTTLLPPLPQVRKLTVTEKKCQVLLNREMPNLTDCTVPSPSSLGPNLFCPALKCIRFTGELSDIEKELCLNRATYEAIGAHPRWIIHGENGEVVRTSWDRVPSASGKSMLGGPLGDGGNPAVSPD